MWDLSAMLHRARLGPALFAIALFVAVFAWIRPASAWVDVYVEGDEVKVSLDRSGKARVEHRISLKIAGGPLRAFDLPGVDEDATPEPDGYVVPLREAKMHSLASAIPIEAELLPPEHRAADAEGASSQNTLRVRFQNDKGIGRGLYVLLVRYTTDMSQRIAADGSMARLVWRGLVHKDGLDSARVTFELPAAPTEPRADDATARKEEGAPAEAEGVPLFLSTVRRGIATDQIELLRPYAPRGEAVTWAVRADARAFDATSAGRAEDRASTTSDGDHPITAPLRRALIALAAMALLMFYSSLVALKSREVAREATAAFAVPRPLVPLSTPLRALFAGLCLVAGVAVQIALGHATLGALLVLVAIALAAHRTPRWQPAARLRGRGQWLPVAEAEAFRAPPRQRGGYLDASTLAGKLVLLLLLVAVAAIIYRVNEASPYHAHLVAFDATALLAVFCTGRRDELPPNPATAPARMLRGVAKRVRRALGRDALRVVGRIHVPDESAEADELRLAIAPKAALPGFGVIEVGMVYEGGIGGALALPEVLLRVSAGSPCEKAIEELTQRGRASRGRKPNERVFTFSPTLPTERMTAALCVRLLRAVTPSKAEASPKRASSKSGEPRRKAA